MSRIKNAFSRNKAFISFLTAGDPSIEKSKEYILAMANAGADLIEIGIPFSDPVAEGKVIQQANVRALSAGATVEKIFTMLEEVRKETDVPLVFLTYVNPVFHYGYDRFFSRCQQTGVDGIILPDMPYEERGELKEYAKRQSVDVITLIAPTSKQRITQIAADAEGFVYVVSSMGVTGVRSEIQTDLSSMIASIRSVTDTPVAIGFGIGTPEQAKEMSLLADGVIVGSAVVKIIEEYGENAKKPLSDYIKSMKEAIL